MLSSRPSRSRQRSTPRKRPWTRRCPLRRSCRSCSGSRPSSGPSRRRQRCQCWEIVMLTVLAESSVDWTKYLTPEMITTVLGIIAAVLGWLGKLRAQRITAALVKGVEAFRNEYYAKAQDPAASLEKKAELTKVADLLGATIKDKSLEDGIEGYLNPIVQLITATMKQKK